MSEDFLVSLRGRVSGGRRTQNLRGRGLAEVLPLRGRSDRVHVLRVLRVFPSEEMLKTI